MRKFDGFEILDEIGVEKPTPVEKDPIAQQLWDQLHDKLRAAGVLTDLDIPAFTLLCQLYSRLQTERGHVHAELATRFTILLKQFGCTPASRKSMKIDLMRDSEDDEF